MAEIQQTKIMLRIAAGLFLGVMAVIGPVAPGIGQESGVKVVKVNEEVLKLADGSTAVRWEVVLKNETAADLDADGDIDFLDSRGSVLATATFGSEIRSGQENTCSATSPVTLDAARRIATARAKIRKADTDEDASAATSESVHRHGLEILSVGIKIIDTDSDYPSVSWKVVVKNQTRHELRMMGKVHFLDSDGYDVDGDIFTGYISGGGQKTFTGQVPVPRTDAERISAAKAEIEDYFRPDR